MSTAVTSLHSSISTASLQQLAPCAVSTSVTALSSSSLTNLSAQISSSTSSSGDDPLHTARTQTPKCVISGASVSLKSFETVSMDLETKSESESSLSHSSAIPVIVSSYHVPENRSSVQGITSTVSVHSKPLPCPGLSSSPGCVAHPKVVYEVLKKIVAKSPPNDPLAIVSKMLIGTSSNVVKTLSDSQQVQVSSHCTTDSETSKAGNGATGATHFESGPDVTPVESSISGKKSNRPSVEEVVESLRPAALKKTEIVQRLPRSPEPSTSSHKRKTRTPIRMPVNKQPSKTALDKSSSKPSSSNQSPLSQPGSRLALPSLSSAPRNHHSQQLPNLLVAPVTLSSLVPSAHAPGTTGIAVFTTEASTGQPLKVCV